MVFLNDFLGDFLLKAELMVTGAWNFQRRLDMEQVTMCEKQAPFLCIDLRTVNSIAFSYILVSHSYLFRLRIIEHNDLTFVPKGFL